MSQGRESAALRIVESQAIAWKLRFEDAIFFLEVSDGVSTVAIDPACDHGDKERQYHGDFSGWRHR